MSTKKKPGIHLFKTSRHTSELGISQWKYYWHIVASNGRIIARSSETYTRKWGAVKSILIASRIFRVYKNSFMYFDHSKKDSPLQSYL